MNEPANIGNRRELFVDDYLVARMHRLERRLNHPTPQEVVFVSDRPWEGNASGMYTIFQDEGKYRMYYRGLQMTVSKDGLDRPNPEFDCYAESNDGIHWERVELGQVEFKGSTKNNIIRCPEDELGRLSSFSPFKDLNPAAEPDARYKSWAVGKNPDYVGPPKKPGSNALHPLKSADGLHWERMSDRPAITYGRFDTHNVACWDAVRSEYRSFHRNWLESEAYSPHEDGVLNGVRGTRSQRDICTATSQDMVSWSDSEFLHYTEGKPDELYTNSILPYFRAPHIYLGFPMRYIDRGWSDAMEDLPELEHRRLRANLSERYGTALTDAMFMSSRDGRSFKLWHESFIRPGLRPENNWTYADNLPNLGIVTTKSHFAGAPDELSIYTIEGYWRGESLNLRRYTIRQDGFVSLQAPLAGGEVVTKPFFFSGRELTLNFSASAAGSVQVEILWDEEEIAVEGFSLKDCRLILGDDLDRTVVWKTSSDISRLTGIPIRLRFVLKDADLYSFQFQE